MDKDLASLFAEGQTNQIDWDGPLYSLYELPTGANELTIRFLSATAHRPQGLRLKVRGGTFEVESTATDDLVVWQDTAPAEVRVGIRWKSKGARGLRVWNAWRIGDVTQAWLGNAGMRVRVGDDGVFEFRCSDGEGEPDFNDLIADVLVR
jgi:hypothetical protein